MLLQIYEFIMHKLYQCLSSNKKQTMFLFGFIKATLLMMMAFTIRTKTFNKILSNDNNLITENNNL